MSNHQIPKELAKQANRAADEGRARKLLAQAVEKLGQADGLEHEAGNLAERLVGLRKKSIRTYWEAGKLLNEARETAPHGTWKVLRKAVGLAPTTEYLWRDLYRRVSEEEIDRVMELNYSISRVIEEFEIGRKKTDKPMPLPNPGQDTGGDGDAESTAREDDGSLTAQAESVPMPPLDALRVWMDNTAKGGPIAHAANWRGKVLCTGRIIDEAAASLGDESDLTCIKCLGIRTKQRLEAERREREKTPHGSEIGYVWEILDGDDPDAIDARWLPIREVHGQVIVTPEKTFGPNSADLAFGGRYEALETAKARYQQIVEHDQAEIARLKAESDRLREQKRLAERKLQKIESLLAQEA